VEHIAETCYKGLIRAELPTKPRPVNAPISVEPLNHSKGIGLEQDFRNVTKTLLHVAGSD
jgi:hypothetical protein